jgi:hypothetical protein
MEKTFPHQKTRIYRRWRNYAWFMAVRIASKGLSDGTILALVPFFCTLVEQF